LFGDTADGAGCVKIYDVEWEVDLDGGKNARAGELVEIIAIHGNRFTVKLIV
jgi:membrane protein implicated in regulation of membrane protease activity